MKSLFMLAACAASVFGFAPQGPQSPGSSAAAPGGACSGCAKQPFTSENGLIDVIVDLSMQNGQCNGTQPECQATPCPVQQTNVQIKNVSGADLWWQSGAHTDLPKIKLGDGKTLEISVPGVPMACGDQLGYSFYTSATQVLPQASWGWKCTVCN